MNYHSRVWINGELAGGNDDGFLPFEFNVSRDVEFGEENSLVVYVDNYPVEEELPGDGPGWRPYGGILREIDLVATSKRHIDDVSVRAEPDEGTLTLRRRSGTRPTLPR